MSFLESEYGYSAEGLQLLDSEYPKDARAAVRYLGRVAVEIQMALGRISVRLYELDNGRMPGKVSFWVTKDMRELSIGTRWSGQ